MILLAVGALGVTLVRPGTAVPPPGGVATMTKVRLGGADQWVSIHGGDAGNPVLLDPTADLTLDRLVVTGSSSSG